MLGRKKQAPLDPVAIAQAEFSDDHMLVLVVSADPQGRTKLVLDYLALFVEGVLRSSLFELRPSRWRHRADGDGLPFVGRAFLV